MTKPYIVCAACKLEGSQVMLVGPRHWDMTMHSQYDNIFPMRPSEQHWEQGFIDQFGKFYTRTEAMELIKSTGQKINMVRNVHDDELFSEGLY